MFHIGIVEEINHFQSQTIRLWCSERFADVCHVIFILDTFQAFLEFRNIVFPNHIDKTARGKLPSIDHINIEGIETPILVACPIRVCD